MRSPWSPWRLIPAAIVGIAVAALLSAAAGQVELKVRAGDLGPGTTPPVSASGSPGR